MMGLVVAFLWVPAHSGVRRNRLADRKAKEVTKYTDVAASLSNSLER